MFHSDEPVAALEGFAQRAFEDPAGVGADLAVLVGDSWSVLGAGERRLQTGSGAVMGDAQRVQGSGGVAVRAAEDPQQQVLGAHGGLAKAAGFLAGKLDTATGLAGDEDLRLRAGPALGLLGKVTVLAVRRLLTDPEGTSDLTPGRAGLERPGHPLGLDGVQLVPQRAQRPQGRLRVGSLDRVAGQLLDGGRRRGHRGSYTP